MHKFIEALESILVTATFAEHGMHLSDGSSRFPELAVNGPSTEKAWSA